MSYKHKRRQQKAEYAAKREERAAERKANIQTKWKRPPFSPLQPRSPTGRIVEPPEIQDLRYLPSVMTMPGRDVLKEPSYLQLEARVLAQMPEGFNDWTDEQREEWARREMDAWKAKQEKGKMLAPMYNKGPVQYVGDAPPEIIKSLGKKV